MAKDQELIRKIVEEVMSRVDQDLPEVTLPIGVSARHLHISREHLEVLFGKGARLEKYKELMGGQYASKQKVTLVGTNLRVIENVRILGPERSETQVELAKTDALKLGVVAPVRESGNLVDSAGVTIVGPKGAITLKEGCIVARRHIHMSLEDAKELGFRDKESVSILVEGEREGILRDVLIRVDPTYELEMHIDTDEANALAVQCGGSAKILR